MAEVQVLPNVEGVGKVPPEIPAATPEIKDRSDKRMAMLSKNFINDAERYKSDGGKPEKENSSTTSQSSSPKLPEDKASADSPKPPEKEVKPEEKPKATEAKPEVTQKEVKPAKKLSADDLEKERRTQQGRADKAEAELAKERESATTWQTERAELIKNKELVDQFNSDPVKFVNERLPELGKKLAVAGDPVKMIEAEVGEYYTELEKAFKKDLGEDWRYSEAESMKPGTPSFRFRLAITARTDEARQKASEYVGGQKRQMEEAQRRIVLDKEELIKEYGFTDVDFKEADAILQKEGISFKNLVRLALIDKIIAQKISALPPVHEPSPDLGQTRGASSETPGDDSKPKLSKEGARMASRLSFSRSL
jgi:hypothetical protein